jgi:alpha-galactosidase
MNVSPVETAAVQRVLTRFISGTDPPFSFTYGGRFSKDLLRNWDFAHATRQLDGERIEHVMLHNDSETGLQVRCILIEYRDFPALQWVLYFKNASVETTPIIKSIQALDVVMHCQRNRFTLHYAKGALASIDDFMPIQKDLNLDEEFLLRPGGGRSSSEFLPFFNIEMEEEGVILAIGWTGEWAALFKRSSGNELRLQAGMETTNLRLYPGEEIRSPRILLLFWSKDWMRGQNMLRRFILTHHRPSVDGKPLVAPVFFSSWGGTPAKTHLDTIGKIINHDLPVEYYWIDAEWFGGQPWWKNVGNWEVREDLYPEGFKEIAATLHKSGRKLSLWFEPERVCKDTPWYREHCNWLLKIKSVDTVFSWPHYFDKNDPAWVFFESRRNQIAEGDTLFNLGNPQARRFLTDFISNRIAEFHIDCYRHDANIAPLRFWRNADSEDRQGITEIRYVEGLYAFWDDLLQKHPNLIIDNCASGGRRIDLETIGRSTPFWSTDFIDGPVANQCHVYGLLLWIPLFGAGGLNMAKADDYAFRSVMCASMVFTLGIEESISGGETIFNSVRKKLNQYLSIRKFYYGDYYPLTPYTQSEEAWMAYQLDRPDLAEGLVVVLKRRLSPLADAVFRLRELQPDAHYEITDLDTGEKRTLTGKELMDEGLKVHLAKNPDSTLIMYRCGQE